MKRESSRLICDVISEYVKEDKMESGLLRARIFEAWDLVTGNPDYTSTKYYKEKVLTCKITSSVVRSQMRCYLDSYRNQLNTLLQGDYVDKIILS